MSTHAASADARPLARRIAVPRVGVASLATVAFTALLAAVALEGEGGLQLGPLTTVEIALQVVAGVAAAGALLLGGHTRRVYGALPLGLFAVLVALTAASIGWAIEPGDAWIEANRTLAWCAVFALGVALVRLWPERWPALTGGMIGAALVICGYAVLTKVFPGALSADETYARLREPFGYWNSVGLMAAMAAPACLWLGARRSGHAALNALAYPALGLLVVACLLAYSRGSLLAMGAGCAVWFAVVPLRLRGASVFGIGGLGGLFVGLWAFGQDALSNDRVPLDERTAAGHELGVLLVVMLAILLVAGLAVNFALAERAPSLPARRRAGAVVAASVALLPIVLAGSLALSERGLAGSISKAWDDLTNPAASTPANDPTRLTAIGSVRARYWNEALQIWEANKAVGVGAGGYRTARPRYRDDTLNVRHAHGYLVQTMSDLGLVGLAVSLALLAAWLAGAARTTGPWRGPARATFTPERIGLLTMCAVVVVFGVHSLIDWTWFVPGNVVPALLCAGWVAGRGPLTEPVGARRPWRERLELSVRRPVAVGAAVAAIVVAGVSAWATYGPQRSVNAANDALEALEAGRVPEARADIRRARNADPLSTNPLYAGSTVELSAGNTEGARRRLEEAVRLHPSTAEPWLRLAQFELDHDHPQAALRRIGPALYLDPRSATVQATWLEASRQETGRRNAAAERKRGSGKGKP